MNAPELRPSQDPGFTLDMENRIGIETRVPKARESSENSLMSQITVAAKSAIADIAVFLLHDLPTILGGKEK